MEHENSPHGMIKTKFIGRKIAFHESGKSFLDWAVKWINVIIFSAHNSLSKVKLVSLNKCIYHFSVDDRIFDTQKIINIYNFFTKNNYFSLIYNFLKYLNFSN